MFKIESMQTHKGPSVFLDGSGNRYMVVRIVNKSSDSKTYIAEHIQSEKRVTFECELEITSEILDQVFSQAKARDDG